MSPATHCWNAEDYARNSSAQLQWAQELIARLALRGGESVLDIGCGDGKISARLALAANPGNVLGIDLSAAMIRFAADQFPPCRYPNLSFRCMDATDIRLTERFDVAFSTAALHWVEDHAAVLRGVRACLEPGGRLLFQMGGRGNAAAVFDAIQQVARQPRWQRYYAGFTPPYHFYGPEEYEGWLSRAAFVPGRVELVPKDMRHRGAEGFRGWLRTPWFPYTDCLPVERRDVFLAEVDETYMAAHPLDAFGHSHVGMVRLEVEAYAR
jgi:trans-aconitate 2-methyltransferase